MKKNGECLMNNEKVRRYLVEALHASYGCTSATCQMNPKGEGICGTAHMCNCKYVFETMVGALNQIVEESK